jgi:hypothetical protein
MWLWLSRVKFPAIGLVAGNLRAAGLASATGLVARFSGLSGISATAAGRIIVCAVVVGIFFLHVSSPLWSVRVKGQRILLR